MKVLLWKELMKKRPLTIKCTKLNVKNLSFYTDNKILTKSFMVTVDVTTLGSLTGMLGYTTKNLALYSQQIFLVKWLRWTTAHPRAMPGHLKWQPASSSSKKMAQHTDGFASPNSVQGGDNYL